MQHINLTGKKLNKLLVLRQTSATRKGHRFWECLCECGKIKSYSTDHLTRKTNPVKSCGCIKFIRGPQHRDWNGYGEISGHWWHIHLTRELSIGNNRHRINVKVTIQQAWKLFLKQKRKCSLSGIELFIDNRSHHNTASIDRIDSSKGYELSNIQWVHKHINFMKRDFTMDYFIDMCKKVVKQNKREYTRYEKS